MKKKKYTLKYRRLTVYLDFNPRKDKCECCGRKSKYLQCHHWKYQYKTEEVKLNPMLATYNISTVCYYCHRYANALKFVLEKIDMFRKLISLIPEDMRLLK